MITTNNAHNANPLLRGIVHSDVDENDDHVYLVDPPEVIELLKEHRYALCLSYLRIDDDFEIEGVRDETVDLDFYNAEFEGDVTIRGCALNSINLHFADFADKLILESVWLNGNFIIDRDVMQDLIRKEKVVLKNVSIGGEMILMDS